MGARGWGGNGGDARKGRGTPTTMDIGPAARPGKSAAFADARKIGEQYAKFRTFAIEGIPQ